MQQKNGNSAIGENASQRLAVNTTKAGAFAERISFIIGTQWGTGRGKRVNKN
jgi:hypothetical protein